MIPGALCLGDHACSRTARCSAILDGPWRITVKLEDDHDCQGAQRRA